MTIAEWHATLFQFIECTVALFSLIASIVAVVFTYKNLTEMKKQLKEQQNQYFEGNRGNLVFYIPKSPVGITHDLIIKNFGNAPAKLLSLSITPDLDWSKEGHPDIENFNITSLKNIFLHLGSMLALFLTSRILKKQNWMFPLNTRLAGKTFPSNTALILTIFTKY